MGKKSKKKKAKQNLAEGVEVKKKRKKGPKKEKKILLPGEYKMSKHLEIVKEKILKEYRWNLHHQKVEDDDYNSIVTQQIVKALCPDATEIADELQEEILKHVGTTNSNIFSEYLERDADNPMKNARIVIGSCALLLMAEYGYTLDGVVQIFQSERWKKKFKPKEITLRIDNAVRKICMYESLDDFLREKIQSYQPKDIEEE